MEQKLYMVRTGSGNARGKSYYFDDYEEALKKAQALQKARKDNSRSLFIKGTQENGKYIYYYKDLIEYENL